MNTPSHYSLSLFTFSDLDDLPRSVFALVGDDHIARLTEQARQATEDLPIPPSVCTDCGDTFTMTYYRPGTAERVWCCGTPSCDCFKGVAL